MAVRFDIRFDGLDAKEHTIDMRELGTALVGFEKAISDSVFLATEGRLPKPRERRSLVVKVEAPKAACVELQGTVEAASGLLPIALEILKNPGTHFIFQMLSFVLKKAGGKPKEAEAHVLEAIRALNDDRASERAASLESQRMFHEAADRLAERLIAGGAVRQMVAPVGRTSETLSIGAPPGLPPTVVDVPMAEAVRSKEPLEVGEMTRMRVRVDGLIQHSRQLKVEIEDRPGHYVNADVRDPAFDERPNVYTDAVSSAGYILIDAKPTYREGELVKLHIMNAVRN